MPKKWLETRLRRCWAPAQSTCRIRLVYIFLLFFVHRVLAKRPVFREGTKVPSFVYTLILPLSWEGAQTHWKNWRTATPNTETEHADSQKYSHLFQTRTFGPRVVFLPVSYVQQLSQVDNLNLASGKKDGIRSLDLPLYILFRWFLWMKLTYTIL